MRVERNQEPSLDAPEREPGDLPADPPAVRAPSGITFTLETKLQGPLPPLTKLVSRIPPPPRLPRVDGVKLFAPTVRELPPDAPLPEISAAPPSPRAPSTQRTRRQISILQAWVVAFVALGAGGYAVYATWSETHGGVPSEWLAQAEQARMTGQLDVAEAQYRRVLSREQSTAALRGMCQTELARKDARAALTFCTRSLQATPQSQEAHALVLQAKSLIASGARAQ